VWLLAAVTAGSLAMSLARNMWLGMAIGLVAILVVGRRLMPWRSRALKWTGLFMFLAVFFQILTSSDANNLFRARLDQLVGGSLHSDSSMIWRLMETEEALRVIAEKPFVGHGLGAKYYDAPINEGLSYYVHNDFLFTWLKLGAPGLFAILIALLGAVSLLYGVCRASMRANRERLSLADSFTMGGLAWLITMIPVALVRPVFAQVSGGIIMYSMLVAFGLHKRHGQSIGTGCP
jgi:O-antigen ligase